MASIDDGCMSKYVYHNSNNESSTYVVLLYVCRLASVIKSVKPNGNIFPCRMLMSKIYRARLNDHRATKGAVN